MPHRFRAALATGLLALTFSACVAGPHQLRRTVDDWDHSLYVNSPWFDVLLWVVPVIPAAYVGAIACDFLVGDAWAFWTDDAWDGAGTGFEHFPVEPTDGRVNSMMFPHGSWTRVEK
ncbi:MAG: hypothetical protein KF830_16105 [Planctomycetes bacterium]|nr:hypothetical protein [Planctomycetota bacterium]